jgi:AraC-like DNA-binding protein
VGLHAHDEPELVFCTAGTITIDVGGQSFMGRPGDLCVLPARVPHAVRSEASWENICVLFSGGGTILPTDARMVPLGEDRLGASWFLHLCELHDGRPRLPGPVADSSLATLVLRIAEMERQGRAKRDLHPRVARAIALIHDNADRSLSARDLAEATFTSYSHLAALFRSRFGCAPLVYHRQHRMERAKALLAAPYVTVTEAVSRIGYADPSHFVRVFRKTCGVSPNRWRKRAEDGKPGG